MVKEEGKKILVDEEFLLKLGDAVKNHEDRLQEIEKPKAGTLNIPVKEESVPSPIKITLDKRGTDMSVDGYLKGKHRSDSDLQMIGNQLAVELRQVLNRYPIATLVIKYRG